MLESGLNPEVDRALTLVELYPKDFVGVLRRIEQVFEVERYEVALRRRQLVLPPASRAEACAGAVRTNPVWV